MSKNDASLPQTEPWERASPRVPARDHVRERFLAAIHGSVDLEEVAYAIVNEGRRLLGCDRVSLVEVHRKRTRLLAVSGTDEPARQSSVVRSLERLSALVSNVDEPIWYGGDSSPLPPQLQEALDEYINHANVRRLAIVPLKGRAKDSDVSFEASDRPAIGMLVVEDFRALVDEDDLWAGVEDIRPQVGLALQNALTLQRMPLAGLSRSLKVAAEKLYAPRTMLALAAMALLFVAMFMIKTDLNVRASGSLQRQLRREVFAPADATVASVVATHGDQVRQGDVLIELSSPTLDLEISRVTGELRTAQQQLQSLEAQLWNAEEEDDDTMAEIQLSAQQQRLQQQIQGLQEQRRLLEREQQELSVVAPIDGCVQTWNTSQLLANRPVRRGQSLMTVADANSHWMAELVIRDQDVGCLLAGQDVAGDDLAVTLMLATDPWKSYSGRIERTAVAAFQNEVGETQLRLDVALIASDKIASNKIASDKNGARAGAEVIAKIDCGRRSLAYVWTNSLVSAVQRLLFL